MTRTVICLLLSSLSVVACSSDDEARTDSTDPTGSEGPAPADDDPASAPPEQASAPPGPSTTLATLADCERGSLEPDLLAAPLAGPGVVNGVLMPGEYVVSTTYLQLGQDGPSQQLFEELVAPVLADLETRPGLLGLALGQSASCGVVRTLGVWQDDVAMIAFVTSPAHTAAMARVTDMSRGGSVVTHWLGDETSADWATAAVRIGADEGPLY